MPLPFDWWLLCCSQGKSPGLNRAPSPPGEETWLFLPCAHVQGHLCWWLCHAALDSLAPELPVSLFHVRWFCCHHLNQVGTVSSHGLWTQVLGTPLLLHKITPGLFTSQSPGLLGLSIQRKGEFFLPNPGTVCISCPRIYPFVRWLIAKIATPWTYNHLNWI